LLDGQNAANLSIALGPQTGQCCGGKVMLEIRRITDESEGKETDDLLASVKNRHHVYVFGAGHVGSALAKALSLLPLQTILVDTRADLLQSVILPCIKTLHTNHPEEIVNKARSNSAFVVLTHDHALDGRIASAVLERGDFRYLGIIGSRTKRHRFINAFIQTGIPEDRIARLVCPIGGAALRDKRPAVIASLAAAEIVVSLFQP
jgi:xanthine dehydrogenase accessory factor